jgi:DNA-binding beta-propeller fold protein YncE
MSVSCWKALLWLSIPPALLAQTYAVSTLSGEFSDLSGYSGDGGPATEARLNSPRGLAIGADGTLYIFDSGNVRVRAVDPAGRIRTVAGNGEDGFSGDGSPATQAKLSRGAIAIDSKGNLYVAGGNRIRRITPDGLIQTFAGTGARGYDGDNGPALKATFTGPLAMIIAEDDTVYFISEDRHGALKPYPSSDMDTMNFAIRKIDANGTVARVATIPGGHSYCSEQPQAAPGGLARDGSGTFFVPYSGRQQVIKVDGSGVATVFAGHGYGRSDLGANEHWAFPCPPSDLFHPEAVALDGAGNLLVATMNQVRRVDVKHRITTVLGSDGANSLQTSLSSPGAVAVDRAGVIYVSDTLHDRVLRLDARGMLSVVAGLSDPPAEQQGGSAKWARYRLPGAIAVGPSGDVFIADGGMNRICHITPDGRFFRVAGTGTRNTFEFSPHGGGLRPPSTFSGDGGPAIKAELAWPEGIAVDARGNLFIADTWNNRIRKVTPDGIIHTIAGTGEFGSSGDGGPATLAQLRTPTALALDARGNLYIADTGNNRIRKLTVDNKISTVAGTIGLNAPRGIALNGNGALYVADTGDRRVQRLEKSGALRTIASTGGSEELASPNSLAIDARGNIILSAEWLRRIGPRGILQDLTNDSGQRILAHQAWSPIGTTGLAVDKQGAVYVTDQNRVLILTPHAH